jgi:hypothetical protein
MDLAALSNQLHIMHLPMTSKHKDLHPWTVQSAPGVLQEPEAWDVHANVIL